MTMKLLNRTSIPDAILTAILLKAGRAVGAKTSKALVQVNPAQYYRSRIRGTAYNAAWVKWGGTKRKTTCEGAFRISLPLFTTESSIVPRIREKLVATDPNVVAHRRSNYDALTIAENFFFVARHEWGHVKDFQSRNDLQWSNQSRAGRRPRHGSRPEEIRTENYAYDADERDRGVRWAQDEVLELALALDEIARRTV